MSASTNSSGDASFSASVPGATVGHVITATATDQGTKDTSAFSLCETVASGGGGGPTNTAWTSSGDAGGTVVNNGTSGSPEFSYKSTSAIPAAAFP